MNLFTHGIKKQIPVFLARCTDLSGFPHQVTRAVKHMIIERFNLGNHQINHTVIQEADLLLTQIGQYGIVAERKLIIKLVEFRGISTQGFSNGKFLAQLGLSIIMIHQQQQLITGNQPIFGRLG
jgi:hypothetical protein